MSVTVKQVLEIINNTNLFESIDSIDVDVPLADQGVDSLEFSNILFNIEEAFNIEIPDEDVDELLTVNDITFYLNNKLDSRP